MAALPSSSDASLDPSLRSFVLVTEVDEGGRIADGLFQRTYAHSAPTYPHHLATFFVRAPGRYELVHDLHFVSSGNVWLIGGACTDGDVVRRMSAEQRAAVDAAGGLM